MKIKKLLNFIIPIFIMLFNIFILLNPGEIIQSAKEGIDLWFFTVFPSLFPFIIGTNILTGLGFVNFLGVFLEPIMYPLFGVPGQGGFALITGLTSGYPMGAKITGDLRQHGEITKEEAQRLLSFTNNSGPLFVIGAVGIGLYQNPRIGYFILLIHYLAAIINGLVFKNYKYKTYKEKPGKQLFKKSYYSAKAYRYKGNKKFSQVLADSVRNGMESIIQVGGFIIIFCVLAKIMELSNITAMVKYILSPISSKLEPGIFEGVFIGLIEMTNGAKLLSSANHTAANIIACAGIISFGGFSIHAQSINFLYKTDVNLFIYILSKAFHGLITVILGLIIYPFFSFEQNTAVISVFNSSGVIERLAMSSAGFLLAVVLTLVFIILANLFRLNTKGT